MRCKPNIHKQGKIFGTVSLTYSNKANKANIPNPKLMLGYKNF